MIRNEKVAVFFFDSEDKMNRAYNLLGQKNCSVEYEKRVAQSHENPYWIVCKNNDFDLLMGIWSIGRPLSMSKESISYVNHNFGVLYGPEVEDKSRRC
jgi:hypothetical protein